jgi:signal transduction histidine kinase
VNLEPGPDPDLLRDTLAKALGDPSLRLAFRVADGDGYLDTSGLPVGSAPPTGRVHTPLGPAGDAILVHDEELRHEPGLVRAAAAAARLALEHARLQAEIRAQLDQVRASRTRIVEAGDTARRRIERDLHDGAQQRLVTLSLALALARRQAEGTSPGLEELLQTASEEAAGAIAELRELARGIHPAVLTESGLAGAVQSLAERSPVPVVIVAVPGGRFPAQIEATAYFVVSEALANVAKHAPSATARVTISQRTEQIVIQVSDDGPGGARPEAGSGLRGLADRVASVGGLLRVEDAAARGTRIEAAIPCR